MEAKEEEVVHKPVTSRLALLKQPVEMKGQGTGYFGVVQRLIETGDAEYQPPSFPFELFPACLEEWKQTPPAFGNDMKRLYSIDPDVVFLNHGSYGAAPRIVAKVQRSWQKHAVRFKTSLLAFVHCYLLPHSTRGHHSGETTMSVFQYRAVPSASLCRSSARAIHWYDQVQSFGVKI